jgi:hypothetical protein
LHLVHSPLPAGCLTRLRLLPIFSVQIDWIKKNKVAENIAYVIHVEDIVDSGDKFPKEWSNAVEAILSLETPLPGLPNGIPYGLAVGNHDQAKVSFH